MINTNYKIKALNYLLDKECLMERYYPLVQIKKELITSLKKLGCKTKDDIASLSDSELKKIGLKDEETIKLLRRFLTIYDPNPLKFKEIEKFDLDNKEAKAFEELYYLPGVKQTRASLYFKSGFKSLKDIADANADDILSKTSLTILRYKLPYKAPLPKEVRTHIAVAKAFTYDVLK